MVDVLNFTHHYLVKLIEDDARAALASGRSDDTSSAARERLEELLDAPLHQGRTIPADELALRRALGVA